MTTCATLLLAICATQLACGGGGGEFIELPVANGTQSWLFIPEVGIPTLFAADEALFLEPFDNACLTALPLSAAQLGASGEVSLQTGQVLPVLASFEFTDTGWQPSEPLTLRLPFEPSRCGQQCLAVAECARCSQAQVAQVCDVCRERAAIVPPELPPRVCPPGWQSSETAEGHFSCFASEPPGIDRACPGDQRWSMSQARCVAIAPCEAPTLPPNVTAVYVDASAAAGGDGSAALPFRTLPRLQASMTVVIAPGEYEAPVRVDAPDVHLLGHGICTVLSAPIDVDVVGLNAPGAVIRKMSIVAQGSARALVITSSSSALVDSCRIEAQSGAVVAAGPINLNSSRIVSSAACDSDCEATDAAVFATADGVLSEVDIEGVAGVFGEGASFTLRDTRLVSVRGKVCLSAKAGRSHMVERVASYGYENGFEFSADTPMEVNITDLVIRSPGLFGVSVGQDRDFEANPGPHQVTMERVDIEAGTALALWGLDADIRDVHLRAGIGVDSQGVLPVSVSVTGAWIEFHNAALQHNTSGAQVALRDAWIYGSPLAVTPQPQPQPTAILSLADFVEIGRTHLIANGRPALATQFVTQVNDLTVTKGGSRFQIPGIISADSVTGSRWDVMGDGAGLVLSGFFDLRNVRLFPSRPDLGFSPVCLASNAKGTMQDFEVSPSPDSPSWLIDASWADGNDDVLFFNGTAPTSEMVGAAFNCRSTGEPASRWPTFDNVDQP